MQPSPPPSENSIVTPNLKNWVKMDKQRYQFAQYTWLPRGRHMKAALLGNFPRFQCEFSKNSCRNPWRVNVQGLLETSMTLHISIPRGFIGEILSKSEWVHLMLWLFFINGYLCLTINSKNASTCGQFLSSATLTSLWWASASRFSISTGRNYCDMT